MRINVLLYDCRKKCDRREVKQMVNIDKLRGVMREKRITVEMLADAIGINRATLYRKFNSGGENLTVGEVIAIGKYLKLDGNTAMNIFFDFNVA